MSGRTMTPAMERELRVLRDWGISRIHGSVAAALERRGWAVRGPTGCGWRITDRGVRALAVREDR